MKPRFCIDLFFLGVHDARWYPLYDLYASSQDGKPSTSVSLHYRVNLSQRTGESWNNAKLILSTSETDVLNAGVPKTDALVVEAKQPSPPPSAMRHRVISEECVRKAKRRRRGRRGGVSESESELESDEDEDVDEEYCEQYFDSPDLLGGVLPEMSEGGAVVSKTPMGVNYTVDGLTTIRSDGESHKVLVAIVPFEAVVSHITTPRKSPLAYLQVHPPLTPVHHPAYHLMAYSVR